MMNAVVNAAGTWMWNNRTHGELKWTTIETEHFNIHYHQNLDKIAHGTQEWKPLIKDFYFPFEETVEQKDKELHKKDMTTLEVTEEKCPECGKHLLIKLGKYGRFYSCSGFPDCEYAKPILANPEELDQDHGKCDKCDDGVMIIKQ